jgi:raffinose/stachyose/melibiose transport system substrate-binding protein
MPSEEWKNGVGTALTAYAAGTGDWAGVKTAFVDGWAKEYKPPHTADKSYKAS